MQGKIIKGIAGFYYVHVVESGIYECKARGVFRKDKKKPLVGDNVEIEVLDEQEKTGNIINILPRMNELIRPAVANIDQALVVFAVTEPKPHFNLLDRFLVMMESKEIPAILCFNKKDIAMKQEVAELEEVYRACGYPLILISAKEEENIEEIKKYFEERQQRSQVRPELGNLLDQLASVRYSDGDRKYQQEDCKRKAHNKTFGAYYN